jgi:AMP-binding enzyme
MKSAGRFDHFAARWQTAVVLKRDVFSTVERGTFISDAGDVAGVLRRLDEVPWWSRPLAIHLFNRERRALAAVTRLGVAPPLLYSDELRLVRGYIPGSALKIARPFGDLAYFRSARVALRAVHRLRITHNDLAKEQNWLRSPDGRAYLLDFQLASVFRRRNWLFRILAYEDLRHFLKHKRRYVPDALTAMEKRVLSRKSLPTRIWMSTGKKIYILVTRGLLGFIDSEGGGKRMAEDVPAIETALRAIGGVRDAAVLDFPDRKRGIGLYAFVEADGTASEDELRDALAREIGADKLPEFIQVVEALPRRPEGTVRRDVLRLISTNQVDMIEPLLTSPEEARLVEGIVARRKNLFGAPAIAAALASHPDVRDAAVMVYPDRLAGAGLYAFVETRAAVGEERLQDFIAAAIGRDNAPQFIQVVPALPRNAGGQVRTDILQLVATNQVDSIDPLITSEAERRIVDEILNARHNMRDRFVM